MGILHDPNVFIGLIYAFMLAFVIITGEILMYQYYKMEKREQLKFDKENETYKYRNR